MKLKVIACNVFQREICLAIAESPHLIDVEFAELGEHVNSNGLRSRLQTRIDAIDREPHNYAAIVLAYGLCGNATVGLRAHRTPLVIPRAHDCCTILLGSRARFSELFKDNPSTPFSSNGYLDRGDYYLRADGVITSADGVVQEYSTLVAEYGEENARFIWDSMHPKREGESNRVYFIDIPEFAGLGHASRFQARAAGDGREVRTVPGDLGLIRRLLRAEWDPADFLTVEPGHEIAGVYDWEEIIRSKPAAT